MQEGQAFEILTNYDDKECFVLAVAAISRIKENQAYELFKKLKGRFGWEGTIFNREDVEAYLERALTDEEWVKFQNTRSWMKGLDERLCEHGWPAVGAALDEAGIKNEDEDDG